jgi:hypothetical protein
MLYTAQTTRCQTKEISEQNREICGRNAKGLVSGTMLTLVWTENLSQDKQCPGQDMNPRPPNTRQKWHIAHQDIQFKHLK